MQRSVCTAVTNTSDPFDSVPNTLAKARPRGYSHLDASPSFGRGLENSANFPSLNGDLFGRKVKPTLHTCVVEPDNPHRFDLQPSNQVKRPVGQPESETAHLNVHLPLPLKHHLPPSPSGRSIGAYAQTRSLQPSASLLSLDKSATQDVRACGSHNASSPPAKATGRYSKDSSSSADYHAPRHVLYQVDLNQHHRTSTKASAENAASKFHQLQKTSEPRVPPSAPTFSYKASQNRFRSESLSSQTTRSSNHQYRSTPTYHNHTAPHPKFSTQSTLAPAVQLSSDMPALPRPHTLRSASSAAASQKERAKSEAKMKRRHAVYHTLPFKIDPDNKLVSLSKDDRDASDYEDGKSTASVCGSPYSSRTQELDKQESNPVPNHQEVIAANSLRRDSTPRKSILKSTSESTPKASSSTRSLAEARLPRSKSSQLRLLPPRPLVIIKKIPDGPKTEYRWRDPGSYPPPFQDLLLEIDARIREWERR